jgi:hypothetical protein
VRAGPSSAVLPVVPRPERDERLSSWLNRLAQLYATSVTAFLEYCGLNSDDVVALEWRLGEREGAALASRAGMTIEALRTMTFQEIAPHARLMLAPGGRFVCLHCPPDVRRKRRALPWNFWCREHNVRFEWRDGENLQVWMKETVLTRLDVNAREGAIRLADWARGSDAGAPSVPELLNFVTTRYRKSSPLPLAKQLPSLAAGRTGGAFLTRPTSRHALLVIVPEYDRVATGFDRPLRSGLFSLARGSFLQKYALTVAVGRLAADPVGYAASVLLASDHEGEERLQQALQTWPLSLRKRIFVRRHRVVAAHSVPEQENYAHVRRNGHQS